MFSIATGNVDVVKASVRKPGVRDNYGTTALMYAAQRAYTEIVETLLENEKSLQDNGGGTTPVYTA